MQTEVVIESDMPLVPPPMQCLQGLSSLPCMRLGAAVT